MTARRHNGEVAVSIGSETAIIRFSWARLAELREAFGDGFDEHVTTALRTNDVAAVARILAIGTGRTEADVLAASPPLVPTIAALHDALLAAYFGSEGPPEPKPGNVLSRLMRPVIQFMGRFGRRSAQA